MKLSIFVAYKAVNGIAKTHIPTFRSLPSDAGMALLTALLVLSAASANAQSDRQYIREGNALYRQKDFANAEVMYRKALAQNEDNAHAMYNLGCALMMQNKDSAAVVAYENASKIETNKTRQSKIYHNIGVICQNHQMYDDAINAYKQSLRRNPTDDETRYNLALCQKLRKNQPNNKDNQKQNQQQKDNKQDQDKQNKDQNKENQDNKDQNKDKEQKQQPQEGMSKENAEQLLEAATQNEKATQKQLQKAMQQPRSRKLEKNW